MIILKKTANTQTFYINKNCSSMTDPVYPFYTKNQSDNRYAFKTDINMIYGDIKKALDSINGESSSTVIDSLMLLESTKSNIKEALTNKGEKVTDVFSSYASNINNIKTPKITDKYVNFNYADNITQEDIDAVDFSGLTEVDTTNRKFYYANFAENVNITLPQLTEARGIFSNSKGGIVTLNEDVFENCTTLYQAFTASDIFEHYNYPSPNCTNYSSLFDSLDDTSRLVSFDVNTSAGTTFSNMFNNAPNLVSCKLNISRAETIGTSQSSSFINRCPKLTDLDFYDVITTKSDIYLGNCPSLSSQSVTNLCNALSRRFEVATIYLNATVYNNLTEEQKGIIADKG